MKKFIGHIVILGSVVAITMGFILSRADGHADAFYLKFTSTKKSNLILGTSKAAQGLQPDIFQKINGKEFYNYAFAIYSSPYGKAYLQSIKNKINTKTANQTFILSVDPWSICSTTDGPNDSLDFRENKSYISAITNPNQKINFQYLFNYFDESYYKMLTKNPTAFLHEDGWLEVTLPNDLPSRERRTSFTLAGYQNKIDSYRFSTLRYDYLLKTITFLNNYGKIYLVRLPVHPDLMKLENQVMPNFNQDIQTAVDLSQGYLDMSPENAIFQYTDGVHLTKERGKEVSRIVGEWIKKQQ